MLAWFQSHHRFRHENAVVYVALNNPDLQASQLALHAFAYEDASSIAMGDGSEIENPASNTAPKRPSAIPSNFAVAKFHLKHEGEGSRRHKRQSIWDPVKSGSFGENIVEDHYKYEGCRKVGMMIFFVFIMLPEGMQMTILDTLIPTLVGSVVYGNVQLYSTKKQMWLLPAVDVGAILFCIFFVWLYFKNR